MIFKVALVKLQNDTCLVLAAGIVFAILGRGPRAFQIGKFRAVNWEICYSAQLRHFRSIKKQISYTHTIAFKLKEK